MFRQTKKTFSILSHSGLNDERVKPILNTFARYDANHKSSSFSITGAEDVTANLIDAYSAVPIFKYY